VRPLLLLYNFLLYSTTATSLTGLLSAALLLRTARRQVNRRDRRVFLFFAMLCLAVGIEAGVISLTMGGMPTCSPLSAVVITSRILTRLFETATAATLALRLAGLINGHTDN